MKKSTFYKYLCNLFKYAYSINVHLLASLEHCRVFSSNSNSWKKPCPTVIVRSRTRVPVLVILSRTPYYQAGPQRITMASFGNSRPKTQA